MSYTRSLWPSPFTVQSHLLCLRAPCHSSFWNAPEPLACTDRNRGFFLVLVLILMYVPNCLGLHWSAAIWCLTFGHDFGIVSPHLFIYRQHFIRSVPDRSSFVRHVIEVGGFHAFLLYTNYVSFTSDLSPHHFARYASARPNQSADQYLHSPENKPVDAFSR